ncbi:MAG: hypothetical protein WD333_11875 [Dehalococcoidia bacterium]
MRIVDVDIKELSSASKRGRVRSPETQQLLSIIDELKPHEAKAIVLGPGDTPQKIRSRLTYAARIAGKRLQIALEKDRVLFALTNRPVRRRRRKAA